MRILVVSDAWHPQKNGVVVTMTAVFQRIHDHEIRVVHPGDSDAKPAFRIYQDVTLVKNPFVVVERHLRLSPDRIHIVTEGPLGFATRRLCLQRGHPFTSSYHTQLPEYGWHLYRIPPGLTRGYLAWFHGPSQRVLCRPPAWLSSFVYPRVRPLGPWRGSRIASTRSAQQATPTLLLSAESAKRKMSKRFAG